MEIKLPRSHPGSRNESGAKATAVQTLRGCRAFTECAECLDCGAFTAALSRIGSPFHCFTLSPLLIVWAMVLVLSFGVFPASAQDSGAVSGTVVNSFDGAPLSGATVTVRGTTLATQTDSTGRFELKDLPLGDQVLRFSKSGFAAAVVTDVRVVIGQTTTVNGNLRPEFYEMEEYEVTAEEFTQQTEQIMIERQESSGMLDAMGSEQFSKLGAGDAAEALSKVSGASIADGKFAVIRGLADRYTATTLNGTDLPSADPDRKAAQLDLLPTQIIERMDVAKTFSPDMSGGFAGGAIDIVTKSYPEKGMVSFSLGTSYNTQASLNNNFLKTDQGSTDWRAKDDGTRELPAIARNTVASGTSGPIQNEAAVERSFKSTQLSPLAGDSPLNTSMALAFGDIFKGDDLKFGYLASLTYKNDYKFYDNGISRKYDSPTTIARDKTDSKAVIEYTWSASTAFTLGIGEDHELKFNYLLVQAAEDEARRLQGQDANFTEPGLNYLDQSVLHWTERNLTYYQLAGSHDFPDLKDIAFDWAGAMSTATQDEPDYRIFQFIATPSVPFYQPQASTEPSFPTRYWRELEEENTNLRGDLKIPLASYNSKENFLKTGAALSDSSRDYYQRGFEMRAPNLAHPFYSNGDPQSYLSPTNATLTDYYNFPANLTYQGSQTIKAGHLMGDWAVTESFRLVSGVRFEDSEITLTGRNQTRNQPLQPGNLSSTDWLPSLAGTLFFAENVQLRAAWSQTVVRPTYREIAPVAIYDIGESRTYTGNPNLTFSESSNYDLRLEWYPRPGEIASISLFMKQIDAPIEKTTADFSGDNVSYINYEKADVMGVEVEYRSRLDNLWMPLKEFTFGVNAAYITSEVPLTAEQISLGQDSRGGETTRPLYDQPEYVLNADLTWDYEQTRTTLTIAAGVVGPRLVVVNLNRPDEYEEPAPQLDIFLSQKIGKNWKLKASAKNLLNPSYEVSQSWVTGEKTILKSYTKGITFGLSLGCEF